MIRSIMSGVLAFGLACGPSARLMAQAAGDPGRLGAAWTQCLNALTRSCVLRQAVEVSQSLEDHGLRAQRLASIIETQIAARLTSEASETLDLALPQVRSMPDQPQDSGVLSDLAGALAKLGRVTEALEFAAWIRNPHLRAEAIGRVASVQGEAGGIGEALQLLQSIEDKPTRARTIRRVAWDLRFIAVKRGEEGMIIDALREAQAIEDKDPPPNFFTGMHHPSEFRPPLLIIVEAQAEAGRISAALRVAGSINNRTARAIARASIATRLVNSRRVTEALKIARSIGNKLERDAVLDRMLEPRSEHFVPDEERTTVDGLKEAADAPEDALRVASAFPDQESRATALGIIAAARAKSGDIERALEMISLIGPPKPRFVALFAIADAEAKAGMTAQSISSFDQALQVARAFELRDARLSALARAQAKAGQIAEAMRVTPFIEGTLSSAGHMATTTVAGKVINMEYDRRSALYEIAKAQARAGDVAAALQTARSFQLPEGSHEQLGSGFGVVAEGLAEAGLITEAVRAADAVEDPHWRQELLASIAMARAAAGQIAEAQHVAEAITTKDDRASALVSIGAAQVKAGLKSEALATFAVALLVAQSNPYKHQYVGTLVAAAARLPK